jgi:hypothetical protein
MDALEWEAAKELGLEEGVTPDTTELQKEGNLDEAADRIQDALIEEGDRKTYLNLKEEARGDDTIR